MLRRQRVFVFTCLSAFLAASCGGESTTGPATGSITVNLNVTGQDVPADLTVAVDDAETRSVPADGSVTFSDLTQGQHTVLVSGIPPNCTATTPNPTVVSLAGGETSTVDVSIGCAANVGSIEISVWTNGADFDPDGYVVEVSGIESQPLTTTGSVTLRGVPVGTNTVTITGVAPNCEVLEGESFEVVVAYGETARRGVSVSCYVSSPRIVFSGNRSGRDGIWSMHPDGSGVRLLYETSSPVGSPVWSPDGKRIAFRAYDHWLSEDNGIGIIRADGTGYTQIIRLTGTVYSLEWSPDGTRLAFMWDISGDPEHPDVDNDEICVVNVDGTGFINLSANPGLDRRPTWSADGTRIAFWSDRDNAVYVARADGSGLTRLSPGVEVSWSPTANEIAILRWPHLVIVNETGADIRTIASEFYDAEWSPDGLRLAVTSATDNSLNVMNADGTEVRLLAARVWGNSASPSWSPHGKRIAFWDESGSGASRIFVVDADGGNPIQLTPEGSSDGLPDWGPDLR